jgi:large subunit ribosomal protein L3
MAGHMGHERVTVKNLRVLKVYPDKNVIVVQGAVPGPRRMGLWRFARRPSG